MLLKNYKKYVKRRKIKRKIWKIKEFVKWRNNVLWVLSRMLYWGGFYEILEGRNFSVILKKWNWFNGRSGSRIVNDWL